MWPRFPKPQIVVRNESGIAKEYLKLAKIIRMGCDIVRDINSLTRYF